MGDTKKKMKTTSVKAGNKQDSKARKDSLSPAEIIAAARREAFVDESPPTAFAHFRPLAEKVETANLSVFTGQPLLLRANVLTALGALEPHLEAAVGALREPRLRQVFELPSLTMALEFAVGRVPVARLSAGEIDKMLTEGAPWRELMLSFLEVASHPLLDLLPRERVAAVRAGKGKLDQAQDFVAIPGLFAEFAEALAGKSPFPADKIDLLATLGGTLVKQMRPGNVITEVAKRSKESILRDQLASMVIDRYDYLQVLASIALGKRKADELLPALRSAAVGSRSMSVSEAGSATGQSEGTPTNGASAPTPIAPDA